MHARLRASHLCAGGRGVGCRRYTTRIEADKALYPVLLGNGNLTNEGDVPGGRWAGSRAAHAHAPWP